jgi:hypothetical protein
VYEFDQVDDDVVGSLYEGKLILDSTYGNAAYGCANCCGYYAMGIVPDPFGIGVGFTGQDMILVENACTGIQSYRTTLGYSWGTGNSGIATVNNSGLVSALASGQTSSHSSINLSTPEVWHCPVAPQRVSNVVQAQTPTAVTALNTTVEGAAVCPTGRSGWSRTITAQLVDQFSAPYRVSGIVMADDIQPNTPNNLGISRTNTGSHPTNSEGKWPDTYFVCSTVCQIRNDESDALQYWTYNGSALPHVNRVVYKCASITLDGR